MLLNVINLTNIGIFHQTDFQFSKIFQNNCIIKKLMRLFFSFDIFVLHLQF